jgi:hypothetical protein
MSQISRPAWFDAELDRTGSDVLAGRITHEEGTAILAALIMATGGEFLADVIDRQAAEWAAGIRPEDFTAEPDDGPS